MKRTLKKIWTTLWYYEDPRLEPNEAVSLSIRAFRLYIVMGSEGILTLTNQHLFYRPFGLRFVSWFFRKHAATIGVADIESLESLDWQHRFRGNALWSVWRVRLKSGATYDFQAKGFDKIVSSVSLMSGALAYWPGQSRASH